MARRPPATSVDADTDSVDGLDSPPPRRPAARKGRHKMPQAEKILPVTPHSRAVGACILAHKPEEWPPRSGMQAYHVTAEAYKLSDLDIFLRPARQRDIPHFILVGEEADKRVFLLYVRGNLIHE
jgi:hypothetical protein